MTEKCPWEAGKEYTLRNGMRARVYATDCGGAHPIHGAVFEDEKWRAIVRMSDGRNSPWGEADPYDLLPPPKPRIKRDVWVNVYADACGMPHSSRKNADLIQHPPRIACIKWHIDVEEGHGLDGDPA